jgi:L-aminopeptidase/D-esterase-like protein
MGIGKNAWLFLRSSLVEDSRRDKIAAMPPGFARIPGFKIGHAQDETALTGCTVLLCESGMRAGCDVRGGGLSSRELGVLEAGHLAGEIQALALAGGSSFGLDAACGVVRWCEERGVGFDAGVARVPIVPAAALFDLSFGRADRRPDAAMGYAAAACASEDGASEGNVGAGTGATVGKLFGMERAMKSGIGCWTVEMGGTSGIRVAALTANNALGDVRDLETSRILAGARTGANAREFADTAACLQSGFSREKFAQPNTILTVVATNAALTREQARRVAVMASAGLGRAISPPFSTFDGDVVFALSAGNLAADVNAVGSAAAEAVAQALVRSVTQARSAGGLPGLADW